jgi:hypothetical protein
MVTVGMRCPRCEDAFDVPAELAGEGHRCYKCNVPIQQVLGEKGSHRQGRREVGNWQVQPIATGAVLGAGATVLFGLIGGPIGLTVIGGVCGAVLGFILVAMMAFFILEDVELLLNGTRLTIWAKTFVVLGGVLGACGVTEAGDHEFLLTVGAIGGLVAGGLIGHRLVNGHRSD